MHQFKLQILQILQILRCSTEAVEKAKLATARNGHHDILTVLVAASPFET